MSYLLRDGTEVSRQEIESAFLSGKARLVHGRRMHGTGTDLALDGMDFDTRGACPAMYEESWTETPLTMEAALRAAHC